MLWNVDTLDWKLNKAGAWVEHAIPQVKAREDSIILMHDIHKSTVDHVEPFVKRLQRIEGHRFMLTDDVAAASNERSSASRRGSQAFVRASRSVSPNNVLRRWVLPACAKLTLSNATWLTFRRTYASWAHDKRLLGSVVAQLMGHTERGRFAININMQVLDASLRTAVDRIGGELFTIVHRRKRDRS